MEFGDGHHTNGVPPELDFLNVNDNGQPGLDNQIDDTLFPDMVSSGEIPPLDELVSWIDEQTELDELSVASPAGAGISVDDYEHTYSGQWQQIEELSRTGSKMVRAEIERVWTEMADSMLHISTWLFRKTFAEFLEQKRWHGIDASDDNPGSRNVGMATLIMNQLQAEIAKRLHQVNVSILHATPDFKIQLLNWQESFRDVFSNYPLELVKLMQWILSQEKQIIAIKNSQEESNRPNATGMSAVSAKPSVITALDDVANETFARSSEISMAIVQLEQINQKAATIISSLRSTVQQLQVWTSENVHRIDLFDVEQLNPDQRRKWHDIKQRRDHVIQEKKNMIDQYHIQPMDSLKSVVNRVLDDALVEWQRDQAYKNNGKIVTTFCTIKHLESWCKKLAKVINSDLQQMAELRRMDQELGPVAQYFLVTGQQYKPAGGQQPVQENAIEVIAREYALLLQTLVQKGLVVEKQPPQVLMKDKRFQCQLRHLVSDGLDIHQVPFEVEAWLLNAEQASKVIDGGPLATFGPTGKIFNSTARSDFLDHMRQLTVNMRNMCLKMQQRGANRNAEAVAELKFVMLFRARISVRFPPSQTVNVISQTMSLPIVVISHGKQEADAQATIFWDNAFARVGRTPFEVDDSVSWTWMLDALDCRWKKECEEGGNAEGLTDFAKDYLTMKLFNEKRVGPGAMISWKKFNHDKMFACGDARRELFTFWTWFFKAMELISSSQVKKYWNAKIIHGFLSKADCQRMLQESRRDGVFLFRFSETKLGALSISCNRMLNGQLMVSHLEPDILKNFMVRSLPDMVFDLSYLKCLYPDRPKELIFGNYRVSAPQSSSPTDYVKKEFVVCTPVFHASNAGMDAPSPSVFPPDSEQRDHHPMDDTADNQ